MVSVAASAANMRDGPSTRHDILYQLGWHYPLKVLARQGDWLKVRDFENDVGWVHRELTSRSPTFIVKSRRANVRSGPGTNYRVIARVHYGDVMQTLERAGHWVRIRLPAPRKTGWIAHSLLWGW
jgi:SH3-like domain-containing protein